MDRAEIIALLDRYYETSNAEDWEAIEHHRQTNPKFESVFQEYRETVQGIRIFSREALKQELQAHLAQSLPVEEAPQKAPAPVVDIRRKRGWQRWRNIAAVALVVVLSMVAFQGYQARYERLYQAYAPDRISNIEAGAPETADRLQQLEQSFQAYTDAIELAEEPTGYQAAIKQLAAIPTEVSYYYFWAQYEIALIYLKSENQAAAKEQLERLIAQPGEHIAQEKASELLDQLNRPWWSWSLSF